MRGPRHATPPFPFDGLPPRTTLKGKSAGVYRPARSHGERKRGNGSRVAHFFLPLRVCFIAAGNGHLTTAPLRGSGREVFRASGATRRMGLRRCWISMQTLAVPFIASRERLRGISSLRCSVIIRSRNPLALIISRALRDWSSERMRGDKFNARLRSPRSTSEVMIKPESRSGTSQRTDGQRRIGSCPACGRFNCHFARGFISRVSKIRSRSVRRPVIIRNFSVPSVACPPR